MTVISGNDAATLINGDGEKYAGGVIFKLLRKKCVCNS